MVESPTQIYGLSKSVSGEFELLEWNGKNWNALTSNGDIIDDFYFVSDHEIYAIGKDNQVYLWNGFVWAGITSGSPGIKDHIQVVSRQEIYGVSKDEKLIKWNGLEWQPVIRNGAIQDYFIVKSTTEIYAIDDKQNIAFWNGTTWSEVVNGPFSNRFYVISNSEIFGLGSDRKIWQWNGEQKVVVAELTSSEVGGDAATFYRAKFLGGLLEAQPVLLAFNDRFIIVGQGRDDSLYAREWTPLTMESWDTARNGEYEGLTDWYSLDGSAVASPKLSIENGNLFVTIKNYEGGLYRKQYYSIMNWSSWEFIGFGDLGSGPFSSNGFTIIPSNHTGYPSQVSLVKFKAFNADLTKPNWIDNLIIYEINTQTFTSPNGSQTGNFKSLSEKLDYLQDLGITAIWLSGYSWGDPKHFGYIYTQYAGIHPGLIEPSLGTNSSDIQQTEHEFKDLIATAHQRGIKVIVDMVAHGVMSYSPLVKTNSTMPSYVTAYPNQTDITAHPDWFGAVTNPSYDEIPIDQDFRGINTRMIDFVGGYEQSDLDNWWVDTYTKYILDYGIDGFRIDLGSSRFDLIARIKENAHQAGHDLLIIPEGDPDDYPFDIGVYDFEQVDGEWLPISMLNSHNLPDPAMGIVITDMKKAQDQVFPNLKRQYYTIPVSCHDSMTYNLDGSLFRVGYGSFFTPFIPMFMAGEEFNSTFAPVPNSAGLWLLPSEVQWSELENSKNNDFYQGFKKVISIRETEPALHYFSSEGNNSNVVVVGNFTSSIRASPTPYLRFLPNQREAVLIVGNDNLTSAAAVSVKIPLNQTGLEGFEYYTIRDLWTGDTSVLPRQSMDNYSVTVTSDNFRIIKITPFLSPPTPQPTTPATPTNTPAPNTPSTTAHPTATPYTSQKPTPPQTPIPTQPSNSTSSQTPITPNQQTSPTFSVVFLVTLVVVILVIFGSLFVLRHNKNRH